MKSRLLGALSAGIFVFLPTAPYAALVDSGDYFVFDAGSRWIWSVTENGEVSEAVSIIADDTTLINGVDTIAWEFSDGSKFFFSEDQDGYKIHRLIQPSSAELQPGIFVDVTITLDPPVVFVGQIVNAGDTFPGSGTATVELAGVGADSVPYESQSTFVGIDSVSVPAGDFDDTMHIVSSFSLSGTLLGQPFAQVQGFEQWVGRSVGFVKYIQDANGAITTGELLLACEGFVACFQDVPDSYWSASQIETIAELGITSGCDETHYCPTDPVNRAQMAVFVERGMRGGGYDPGPGVGNIFLDVPLGYWAGGWIELLFMDGITGGCDPTHYCPGQLTTRAEMAVFLLRAKYGMDYAPPTPVGVFNDVAVTYWAAGWIEQLAAEGITSGCGGGNYCPADPVNRDQMAVFLVNTFELP